MEGWRTGPDQPFLGEIGGAIGQFPDLPNGLTGIHQRIHCAATTDTDGVEIDQERIDVDNFLSTLARIALAVAAREQAKLRNDGEVGQ